MTELSESIYAQLASDEEIAKAKAALTEHGIDVTVVDTLEAAKDAALKFVPKGAQAFISSSQTLEKTGIAAVIDESGDYESVRTVMNANYGNDDKKDEMRRLGAAPDYMLGSVHAITQDGQLIIGSNTGSQLPGYAYGAGTVIFVAGSQKIVTDLADGHKRIDEYTVKLEDVRALEAYGAHTALNKQLIITKENQTGRIHLIIVKQNVGF